MHKLEVGGIRALQIKQLLHHPGENVLCLCLLYATSYNSEETTKTYCYTSPSQRLPPRFRTRISDRFGTHEMDCIGTRPMLYTVILRASTVATLPPTPPIKCVYMDSGNRSVFQNDPGGFPEVERAPGIVIRFACGFRLHVFCVGDVCLFKVRGCLRQACMVLSLMCLPLWITIL